MLWDRGYWAPEPGFENIDHALAMLLPVDSTGMALGHRGRTRREGPAGY